MRSTREDSTSAGGNSPSRTLILLVVCLAQFVVLVNVMLMFVALPTIQRDLRFGESDLSWVVNAYTLTFGGFLLLGGRSADILGRKRVFTAGLLLFSAASLLCGLAETGPMLLVFRGLQGLGAALLAPAALSILTTTFPEGPERDRALTLWSAVNAGSAGVGLLLGGAITATLSWPAIFLLNGIFGITIVAVAARLMSESPVRAATSFDFGGAVTATGGILALVYAILKAREIGWDHPITLTSSVAAGALLVAFLVIQRLRQAPLLRLGMFRQRTLTAANMAMFLVAGAPVTVYYLMSLHLQETLGYSVQRAALALLPATAAVAGGSLLTRRLLARRDARFVVVLGLSFVIGGVGLLARMEPGSDYLSHALPAVVITFLGCSCAIVTLFSLATASQPENDAGLASGLITATMQVGSGVWLAVLSSVVAMHTTADDVSGALWGVALLAALAAVVIVAVLRRRHVTIANRP